MEKFFFHLKRFNAIGLALFFIVVMVVAVLQLTSSNLDDVMYDDDVVGFGAERVGENSAIGQEVETRAGKLVAYYESDEDHERKELAGLVLVNLETSKTLELASAGSDHLVSFDFLFDQKAEEKPVIGYIARVATEQQYKVGRSSLIIGALPELTKNTIAEDVEFVDLPTVRSDGSVAMVMWQDQESAEIVSFRLTDGKVIDRAAIKLPIMDPKRVSQGPGRAMNPSLLRDPGFGVAPSDSF
uniref:hypothetical protein n=1 Tax=uncultured Erythrobacter sp. TaxID=263913 RepID=UPI002611A0C7|nr:hypothetical protein [uncultured Erythrobacter sp.]